MACGRASWSELHSVPYGAHPARAGAEVHGSSHPRAERSRARRRPGASRLSIEIREVKPPISSWADISHLEHVHAGAGSLRRGGGTVSRFGAGRSWAGGSREKVYSNTTKPSRIFSRVSKRTRSWRLRSTRWLRCMSRRFATTMRSACRASSLHPIREDYRGYYYLAACARRLETRSGRGRWNSASIHGSQSTLRGSLRTDGQGDDWHRTGRRSRSCSSNAQPSFAPITRRLIFIWAMHIAKPGRDAEAAREFQTVRELNEKQGHVPSLRYHRGGSGK